MVHRSLFLITALGSCLALASCGGPSKTEICRDCAEGSEMKKCRTSYDICKVATYCSVKALKNMCK